MNETEIQNLFVSHPFGVAKQMLIDEITKSGGFLTGNESIFELKAKALESHSATIEENPLSKVVAIEEPDPTHNNEQGKEVETAEWVNAGMGEINETQEELPKFEVTPQETQSKETQSEESETAGEESIEGEVGEEEVEEDPSATHEQQGQENVQEQTETGTPRKRRRRKNKNSSEEETIESKETEAAEKEREAHRLLEEAKNRREEAERLKEEKRRREEEERRKTECQNKEHYKLNEVVRRLKCIDKAFLVGPAGTGKSTLAMDACAKIFGMNSREEVLKSDKFAQISFSPDTLSSDMIGFTDIHGVYHESDIMRVFRNGGVILFDEMDDADASILVKLNTMIANGVMPTPNGVAVRNKETYIIGTANTYGKGANSAYVGRNRLDAATLDRWKLATIEIGYDEELESRIVSCLPVIKQNEIQKSKSAIRKAIMDNRWKSICSTRYVVDATKMMMNGYTINQINDTFLLDWDSNMARTVKQEIKKALTEKE